MLRNHILVAVRNLGKQRFYSFINVFGLAIGLTAALLIGLFVRHEMSYDSFHPLADRIVKANMSYGENEQNAQITKMSPDILLSAFQDEFPEIIGGVRVFDPSGFRPAVVKLRDEVFEESGFMYADSTFFRIFSFPLIVGSAVNVLEKPGNIVLSKKSALKYFPLHDPVGAEIIVDGRSYIITGIMEDAPDNSSIQPSMVASFSTHPGSRRNIWGSANYYTYFLLEEGASTDILQSKIQPYLQRMELSDPEHGAYFNIELIPLKQLHLYSQADSTSDIKYVLIFLAIALLILAIAGINYMNLATARSVGRAKEVGVRKSVGAYRSQLISQFLVEATAISLVACVLAIIMAILLLPLFNNMTGKNFLSSDILTTTTLALVAGASLVIGLLSGIYPALVLSLFKPSQVLKGEYKSSSKSSLLRQGLVVFQFGISVFLIISTIVVGKQMNHIQSVRLGYDRENILVIPINRQIVDRMEIFKSEVITSTNASNISIAGEPPSNIRGGYSLWAEGMEDGVTIDVTAVAIDKDYIPTLGITLIEGSNITEADRKQAEEGKYLFVVNESTLKELMIPLENAVGSRLAMNGRVGTIKGVVKDFHFRTLHQKIAPLVLFPEKFWAYNYALVKITGVNPESMTILQQKWSEFAPETPFAYDFLDDTYNRLYQSEARLGEIFGVFSTVAILIACLGLLGLVSFTAVQRSKEIGIRKILGASVQSVVRMMMSDFGKPVIVAFLLATPLAYLAMTNWLQGFEYKIDVGAGSILSAFAIVLIVAIFSISYQVIKAATSNPVKILKDQ